MMWQMNFLQWSWRLMNSDKNSIIK
uniref:Uncharacterized protein n=1 Tax=Bracon brevicornis TaxID=1563983 RepID=A0A6V7IYI5_9HYME